MTRIIHASNEAHYRWVHKLFRHYADSLGFDLEFQKFSQELATLPGEYAPPSGCILLADVSGEIVGCAALRPLKNRICEMKRLYVIPEYRGQKIGRDLALSIINEARELGYERMRLDTIESMKAAKALYLSLGFRQIKPYRYNPLENPTFMELELNI
jgi:putative acetyltransferase